MARASRQLWLAWSAAGQSLRARLLCSLIFALLLCLMTAMAGASRTLYQGSLDGWMPKYLGRVNRHGAPIAAMWTGLIVNLGLLAIACADSTSFLFHSRRVERWLRYL